MANGSTVRLGNTIVAHNSKTNCTAFHGGTFVDDSYNLQFPGNACGATIPTADPALLPLAWNGGPTQTMALLPGSPAFNQLPLG